MISFEHYVVRRESNILDRPDADNSTNNTSDNNSDILFNLINMSWSRYQQEVKELFEKLSNKDSEIKELFGRLEGKSPAFADKLDINSDKDADEIVSPDADSGSGEDMDN